MTDWLIETTFAVTLLMLLVLAVRRPVAHFFGAGWAYALWLLPALRLILPPLHLFGANMPSLLPRAAAIPEAESAMAPLEVPTMAVFDWEPLLLGLWLTGAASFALWHALSYLAFMRRLGIGSQVQASLAQDVGVIESKEVDGPLAIGLLDRWIVVPVDFTSRYSPEEQRLALQHERIHHQREDIFWNMAALGVLALNWFNPVAYAAFRAFRADQELSCDAAVAAQASRLERADYARALVKSAAQPGLVAGCPLNGADQLKRRLRMMKGHRRSSLRAFGGASAVAALLLTGISVTEAPVAAAPEARPAPRAPAASAPPQAIPTAPAPVAPKAATAPRRKAARKIARGAPPAPERIRPGAPASAPSAAPAPTVAPAPSAPDAPDMLAVPSTLRIGTAAPSAGPRARPGRSAPHGAIGHLKPGTRVRIVRAPLQTAHAVTPELREKLERLLAEHGALRSRTVIFSTTTDRRD
jgi:bla regulator protein BlaR1